MRYLLQAAAAAAARDAHAGHSHAGHSHAGHSHAGHSHADHGAAAAAAAAAPAEYTLDVRIAAIFVIWAGALLFGLPTLVFKQFKNPDALVPRLLRAFAGGTIIALALVHIIPESVEQLHDVIEYHLAGCTVLFGILVLVLIDNSLAACLTPEAHKQQLRAELAAKKAHADGALAAVPSAHKLAAAGSGTCGGGSHSHPRQPSAAAVAGAAAAAAAPAADTAARRDVTSSGKGGDAVADFTGSSDASTLDAVKSAASQSHGHQCLRSLNATGWVSSAAGPLRNVRQYVTAYTMELGCIFHSVIIGVGVGVITGDRQLVITLMIALAIHQGLEGLALGSVLALTTFPTAKKVAMLLLYSITTPIGVAIGIAVASTYDPRSITSRAVQGTISGVSAGMLLYIGMYQLVAEEFSRDDLLVRPRLRFGMYGALLLGAACMCLIGIWA